MEEKKLILKITIPEYPREIQLAKEIRPKYYYWDGITIRAKGKKLLQKFINKKYKNDIIMNNDNVIPIWLKDEYKIVGFKGNKVYSCINVGGYTGEHRINKLTSKQMEKETKYILCEEDSNNGDIDLVYDKYSKVIANSTKAGKPRIQIIKGQDMYSGVLNEFARAKIVNYLKEFYYSNKFDTMTDYFRDGIIERLSSSYPLYIEMEIVDTIKNYYDKTKEGDGQRWDVGNRAYPYIKTFVDFLVNGMPDSNFTGFIEDDDRLHVSGEGYYFTPCDTHENRALIFNIYADKRNINHLK